MTTKTEGLHAGFFLESEAEGTLSREVATVASGETLVAGEVVILSSGKLVAAPLASDGSVNGTIAGIMLDNVDASAGDVANCVYIARLAEVKRGALTTPAGFGVPEAGILTALATLNIRAR
jgi:hypothetical protein